MGEIHQRSKIFYGWWIVLSAAVIQFVGVGIGIFTFSVFLKPLAQEFDWSRGEISWGLSLLSITQIFMQPMYGRWIDRYHPRWVIISASLLTGALFISLGYLTSLLWHFLLLYLLIGFGVAGLTGAPPASIVTRWFRKRRGLALGLSLLGPGFGGMIMVPLAYYFISVFGFRISYILLGFIVWALILPIAIFLLKRDPKDLDLAPDGENPGHEPILSHNKKASLSGLSLREAWRTLNFWLLGSAVFLSGSGMTGLHLHLVPLLTDIGFSPAKAVALFSLSSIASLFGRVTSGYLADKLVAKYVTAAYYLTMTVSFLLLLGGGEGIIYLSIFLFGLGLGAEIDLMAYLVGEYFGFSSFGRIYGFIYAFFQSGVMIGPLFMGYIFDITGSYNSGLIFLAMVTVLASGLVCNVRHDY